MIGDLNQSVEILQETRTPDGGGGSEVVWAVAESFFASIEPRTARLRPLGANAQPVRQMLVVGRHSEKFFINVRLRYKNAIYLVVDVQTNIPRRGYVTMLVEEIKG